MLVREPSKRLPKRRPVHILLSLVETRGDDPASSDTDVLVENPFVDKTAQTKTTGQTGRM